MITRDVVELIAQYSPISTRLSLCLTCKEFNHVINNSVLVWKKELPIVAKYSYYKRFASSVQQIKYVAIICGMLEKWQALESTSTVYKIMKYIVSTNAHGFYYPGRNSTNVSWVLFFQLLLGIHHSRYENIHTSGKRAKVGFTVKTSLLTKYVGFGIGDGEYFFHISSALRGLSCKYLRKYVSHNPGDLNYCLSFSDAIEIINKYMQI